MKTAKPEECEIKRFLAIRRSIKNFRLLLDPQLSLDTLGWTGSTNIGVWVNIQNLVGQISVA